MSSSIKALESKQFLNVVSRVVRDFQLLKRNDRVVVGVSAGVDSMALLRYLETQRRKYQLTLTAVYVNHAQRADALQDQILIQMFCRKRDIGFKSIRIHNRTKNSKKPRSEEFLRKARYRVLMRVAGKLKARVLATGHHQDDQAETVLMRILRGAGLRGLAAIPIHRQEEQIVIIRPFLAVRKQAVINFAKQQGLPYREDSTNQNPTYLRNRVRLDWLPAMRREQPRLDQRLVELAESSKEMYAFLKREAEDMLPRMVRKRARVLSLDLKQVKRLERPLRLELYQLCIERILGNRRSITRKHLLDIDHLARAQGSACVLPRALKVKRNDVRLEFQI